MSYFEETTLFNCALNMSSASLPSMLEIVIPTYNRSKILDKCLFDLAPFVQASFPVLSLRIIDNASTDNTREIAMNYAERYSSISYERNETNIGACKNIAKSIDTSKAEWVWVLGDDDHVLTYAVSYLLQYLEELSSNEDLFLIRALNVVVSTSGAICSIESPTPMERESKYKVYDHGVCIAHHGTIHALAFVSQLIFRPKFWDQAYHDHILKPTDIYAFVIASMHVLQVRKSADLNLHIVGGTHRGDRSYYHSKTCIARLSEFCTFENQVLTSLGRKKGAIVLKQARKNALLQKLPFVLKLSAFRKEFYSEQEHLILRPKSSLYTERLMIRAIEFSTRSRLVRNLMQKFYTKIKNKKLSFDEVNNL